VGESVARRLRWTGKIGIAAPAFTLVCIFLAIGSSPFFSWTDNALSDLGVQCPATAVLFNAGLILGGIVTAIFAVGMLIYVGKDAVGKVATALLLVACASLIAIGVFNEDFGKIHYYVSVAFFVSLPLSMLTFVAAFWREGKRKLSMLTLGLALLAALVWGLQLTIHYVPKVAIPEIISGFAGAIWIWVLSFSMLKEAAAAAQA
jgi:hypothetical membrane protein